MSNREKRGKVWLAVSGLVKSSEGIGWLSKSGMVA